MGGSEQTEVALAGGIAAEHIEKKLRLPVAPTTAAAFNRIKVSLLPIACWRLEDLRFEFDSSFIRPEAAGEFAALARLHRKSAKAPMSIFGHADPVGDDEYNKKLSGRRALAVHAVLVRDVKRWQDLFDKPLGHDEWGERAIQRMLAKLGFDPGLVDGKVGPKTRDATERFQSSKGLEVDGKAGPQTRAALFADYMDAICIDEMGAQFVLTKDEFLGRGAGAKLKGDVQGCGEFNPVLVFSKQEDQAFSKPEKNSERDATNLPNRRVLVFFFEPGTEIEPVKWPCPAAEDGPADCKKQFWPDADAHRSPSDTQRIYSQTHDTMACRFYDRMARRSPCEVARGTVMLRLLNPDNEIIPNARYRLTMPDGEVREGQANKDGFLVEQNIEEPETCIVEFGYPPSSGVSSEERAKRWLYGGPFAYRIEVSMKPDDADSEEESATDRLENLGYPTEGAALSDALIAFQRDYHVFPADGVLGARTKAALKEAVDEGLSEAEFIARHAGDPK